MRHKIEVLKKQALKRQEAPYSIQDLENRVLYWGHNHEEPLRLIGAIQRSPAASRCFVKLQEYTYGNGLKDEQLGAEKINKNQTFDDLLRETTSPIWKLGGFSWAIKWELKENGDVRIGKIYSIPFESVRMGIPSKHGVVSSFVHNPYFGTGEYQKKYNEYYGDFNPDPLVIKSQKEAFAKDGKKYSGQILWIGKNTEFSRFYPRPSWAGDNNNDGGGFQAMENDFLLTRLLGRDLNQGFIQNNVLKMVGDPDAPIPEHYQRQADGESYTTVGEEFKTYMDRNFQGIDGDSMFIFWSKLKEEFPEIEAFPTNFNYEKLKDVADQVSQTVVNSLQVPPILAGIQSSGSISKDDIVSASYLMYSVVRMNQHIISEALSKVLRYWHNPQLAGADTTIENYRPFPEEKQIDPLIWEELTREERRAWIKENTQVQLIEAEPILAKFAQSSWNDYPMAATENAKTALRWADENGWGDCGTQVGKQRANQLAKREPITLDTIKRTYSFLSRSEQWADQELGDGCGRLMWLAWGGGEMLRWSENKIEEIEKQNETPSE